MSNTEKIRKLFKKVVFSDPGSNERRKAENSYMMFVQYLEKCEDEGTIIWIQVFLTVVPFFRFGDCVKQQ